MNCEKCGSEAKTNVCPSCGSATEVKTVQEAFHISACLICGTELPTAAVCPVCGFDRSCDVETFGTICAILPSNIKPLSWHKQHYETAKTQADLDLNHTSLRKAVHNGLLSVKQLQNAAEQGNVIAQFNLGLCYNKGTGVKKDRAKAAVWYQKAATQGNADAQNILGDCYFRGRGVSQDYGKAVQWYQKAAKQPLMLYSVL